jgi:hypothetical protein
VTVNVPLVTAPFDHSPEIASVCPSNVPFGLVAGAVILNAPAGDIADVNPSTKEYGTPAFAKHDDPVNCSDPSTVVPPVESVPDAWYVLDVT